MRRAALALAALASSARAEVTLVARPAATLPQSAPADASQTEAAAPPSGHVTSPWRLGRATFYGDRPSDAGLDAGACGYGDVTSAAADADGAPYGRAGVAAVADVCADLAGCGACYELRCVPARLRGAGGALDRCGALACRAGAQPLHVRVTDACPCSFPANAASNARWCCGDAPHFDLSAWAFDALATSRALGVVPIAFRRVPCAPAGNVSLRVYSVHPGHRAELVIKARDDAACASCVLLSADSCLA
jgi:hypothetical protein